MRKIIEQYPSVIFKLILLNGLVAAIYMSFYLELSQGFYIGERAESYRFLNKYFFLLTGIATIIAGFLVDKIQNIKSSLLIAISSAFLGGILFCFPVEPILFIGALLIFLGIYFSNLLLIINMVVYFPYANDIKDNALIMAAFFAQILGFIATFLSVLFFLNFLYVFIPVCLVLLILINQAEDLGYSVQDEETNDLEEKQDYFPLIFCTTITALATLSSFYFPAIAGGSTIYVPDFFLSSQLYSIIPFLIALIILRFIFLQSETFSRHIKKIIWGLALVVLLGLSELLILFTDSYILDFIADSLSGFIFQLFILPLLTAILTHNNFDENAGLWLGIMIGVPVIIYYSSTEITVALDFEYFPIILFILLIATIIWLRENRDYLVERLNLKEANQDYESEGNDEEDPYDHLILKEGE